MKFSHMLVKGLFALAIAAVPSTFINTNTASAGANTCTWTGAGANTNWSTAGNWSCSVGTVPATGYDLVFPVLPANQTPVNDLLAGNIYTGIWFSGTASSGCGVYDILYTLTGNDLQLAGDILNQVVNGCDDSIYINNNIILTADMAIDQSGATTETRTLQFYGDINMSTFNITISNNLASPYLQRVGFSGGGIISGSGSIAADGSINLGGDYTAFDGDITITNGILDADFDFGQSLGTATGTTTIGVSASLNILKYTSDVIIPEDIIFIGAPFVDGDPTSLDAKFNTYPSGGLGAGFTDYYVSSFVSGYLDFTGDITINQDITVNLSHDSNFDGALNGAGFTFELAYDADPTVRFGSGTMILVPLTNNTLTANGVYQNPVRLFNLSDSKPGWNLEISRHNDVTFTGTRSGARVTQGGILRGTGTFTGGLIAGSSNADIDEAHIHPGLSPGILNTGDLTFFAGAFIEIELEGTTPGSGGHDQFNVTGSVDLGGSTLNIDLYNGYAPNLNDSFTIINNDGADAITGTFGSLIEGATATATNGGFQFTISYTGGDGNDVVLTTSFIPGPPGTGFGVLERSVTAPLTLAAVGMVIAALSGASLRKQKLRR